MTTVKYNTKGGALRTAPSRVLSDTGKACPRLRLSTPPMHTSIKVVITTQAEAGFHLDCAKTPFVTARVPRSAGLQQPLRGAATGPSLHVAEFNTKLAV